MLKITILDIMKISILLIIFGVHECLYSQIGNSGEPNHSFNFNVLEEDAALNVQNTGEYNINVMQLQIRPGIKLSEDDTNIALSAALGFPLGQKWKIIPGISYWKENNLLYDETNSCYGIFVLIEYNIYINNLSFFIGTGGGQYKFSNHSGVYFGLILDTGANYRINKNIFISLGINYPIVFENSSGKSAVLPIIFVGANISIGANK